jgi:hypothetical protein
LSGILDVDANSGAAAGKDVESNGGLQKNISSKLRVGRYILNASYIGQECRDYGEERRCYRSNSRIFTAYEPSRAPRGEDSADDELGQTFWMLLGSTFCILLGLAVLEFR